MNLVFSALTLLSLCHCQEVLLTSTLITDVERTPNYLDQQHAIEGMNFEDIANKVTDEGLKTLKRLAFQFKSKYGSLIPKQYD